MRRSRAVSSRGSVSKRGSISAGKGVSARNGVFQRYDAPEAVGRKADRAAVGLTFAFVRIVVLAIAGIVACVFALIRGWHYKPKPMFTPRADDVTEVELLSNDSSDETGSRN